MGNTGTNQGPGNRRQQIPGVPQMRAGNYLRRRKGTTVVKLPDIGPNSAESNQAGPSTSLGNVSSECSKVRDVKRTSSVSDFNNIDSSSGLQLPPITLNTKKNTPQVRKCEQIIHAGSNTKAKLLSESQSSVSLMPPSLNLEFAKDMMRIKPRHGGKWPKPPSKSELQIGGTARNRKRNDDEESEKEELLLQGKSNKKLSKGGKQSSKKSQKDIQFEKELLESLTEHEILNSGIDTFFRKQEEEDIRGNYFHKSSYKLVYDPTLRVGRYVESLPTPQCVPYNAVASSLKRSEMLNDMIRKCETSDEKLNIPTTNWAFNTNKPPIALKERRKSKF